MSFVDRRSIAGVVAGYFRALRESDPDLIEEAFHPEARIMGAPEGREHVTDRDDFVAFIGDTPSPAAAGEREDMTFTVLHETGSTAAVMCRVLYLGIYVVDLLLLARHVSGWRIMAKVFHREES